MKFPRFAIVLLFLASCTPLQPHTETIKTLKETGYYGLVYHWKESNRNPHPIDLFMPANAPVITADYHGLIGANGAPRFGKHRGIDIYHKPGTPIISAADGVVVKSEVGSCWGPTILIRHGYTADGKPLFTLYGHMRNLMVKVGEKVARGQQIAEMGDDIFNTCGGGLHHLHFQVSHNANGLPIGWGWSYFVGDGMNAPNPHKFWADGVGRITCFDPSRDYTSGGLTYPLMCDGTSGG